MKGQVAAAEDLIGERQNAKRASHKDFVFSVGDVVFVQRLPVPFTSLSSVSGADESGLDADKPRNTSNWRVGKAAGSKNGIMARRQSFRAATRPTHLTLGQQILSRRGSGSYSPGLFESGRSGRIGAAHKHGGGAGLLPSRALSAGAPGKPFQSLAMFFNIVDAGASTSEADTTATQDSSNATGGTQAGAHTRKCSKECKDRTGCPSCKRCSLISSAIDAILPSDTHSARVQEVRVWLTAENEAILASLGREYSSTIANRQNILLHLDDIAKKDNVEAAKPPPPLELDDPTSSAAPNCVRVSSGLSRPLSPSRSKGTSSRSLAAADDNELTAVVDSDGLMRPVHKPRRFDFDLDKVSLEPDFSPEIRRSKVGEEKGDESDEMARSVDFVHFELLDVQCVVEEGDDTSSRIIVHAPCIECQGRFYWTETVDCVWEESEESRRHRVEVEVKLRGMQVFEAPKDVDVDAGVVWISASTMELVRTMVKPVDLLASLVYCLQSRDHSYDRGNDSTSTHKVRVDIPELKLTTSSSQVWSPTFICLRLPLPLSFLSRSVVAFPD